MAELDTSKISPDLTAVNDSWHEAVRLFTGYDAPARDTLFDTLVGNAGIPQMKVEISDVPYVDYVDTEEMNWLYENAGFDIENTDFVIPFYSASGGEGSDVTMHKARITLLGSKSSDGPPAGGVVEGSSFSSHMDNHLDLGKATWDTTKLSQYSYGTGRALEALLWDDAGTHGFSWNSLPVDNANSVTLKNFDVVAGAFDRVAKFFVDQQKKVEEWQSRVGTEKNDAWRGQAAGVFWDLIHKINEQYSDYAEDMSPTGSYLSKQGNEIREAKQALQNAAQNLQTAWADWELKMGNPLRWLHDLLSRVMRYVWDHNITKITYEIVPAGEEYITNYIAEADFDNNARQSTGDDTFQDFGDLKDLGTWANIGNQAVLDWQKSVETYLEKAATEALDQVKDAWSKANFDLGQVKSHGGGGSLGDGFAADEAEVEKEKADQAAADAQAAAAAAAAKQDEYMKWQMEQAAKAEEERAKEKAEAEAKEAAAKAEAEAKEAAAKAEQERKEKEAEAKQAEAEAKAEAKQAEAEARQEQKEAEAKAEQEQKEKEAEAKQAEAERKQEEAQARQEQFQIAQANQARADQERARKEQEQKEKEQEAKAAQKEAEAEAKQAEAEAKQEQKEAEAKAEQEQKEKEAEAKQAEAEAEAEARQAEQEAKQEQKEAEAKAEQEQKEKEAEAKQAEAEAEAEARQAEQEAKQEQKEAEAKAEQEQKEKEAEAKQAEAEAKAEARQAEQESKQEQLQKEAEARQQEAQARYESERREILNSGDLSQLSPTTITGPVNDGSLDLPGGGETHVDSSGRVITEYPDGSSTTIDPVTHSSTMTRPDGTSISGPLNTGDLLTNPDGSATHLDAQGNVVTEYPDGTVQTVDPDTGATTITRPDGTTTSGHLNDGLDLPSSSSRSATLPSYDHSSYEEELYDGDPYRSPLEYGSSTPAETGAPSNRRLLNTGAFPGLDAVGAGVGASTASAGSGAPMGGMPMGGMPMGGMGGMGAGGSGDSNSERVRNVIDSDVVSNRRSRTGPTATRGTRGYADDEVRVAASGPTAGATPLVPPTAGGGGPGRTQTQSSDRARDTWVPEDEDVWGTDEGGAPAVIGR